MVFEPLPLRFRRLPYRWQAAGVLAGALVMAAASQFEVPLGPVPLTLQTLAVFVLAGVMGQRAALSVALWLLAAGLGAPVLAGGGSDVMGPTQGYLVGMVLAAAFTGRIAERTSGPPTLTAAFVVGHAVVLLFGYLGLLRMLPPTEALAQGVLPFIAGALIKSAAAAALTYAFAKAVSRKAAA